MGVYPCWLNGTNGYGCRIRGNKWMFVPELGQPDGTIYKNIVLEQLIFNNSFEKKYEMQREEGLDRFSLTGILKSLILPSRQAHTVCGLLLTTF
ncbi:MAG: hypothetical protein ACE5GZ_01945 [Gammaproteobacteria bacterium]